AVEQCEAMLARAQGDRFVEATAIDMIGGLRAMLGHFDEARTGHAQARRIYEDLGLTIVVASGAMYAAATESLAGDVVAAERELRVGYELLNQLGEHGSLSTIAAFLAQTLYTQGRFEEARTFTVVSERAASSQDVVSQVVWRQVRAKVLARSRELEEAERLAHESLDLSSESDALNVRGDLLLDVAEVLRLLGKPAEALSVCDDALRAYEEKGN